MKKIQYIRNQKGVTIMEVMIAMIVLSLSLLVLLNMAMVAVDGNDWSNKTTRATQMLQQKLEQIRAEGNLSSGNDDTSGITRTWTVTDVGNHLRRVDVTVQWQDIRSQTKSNSVTAYIQTDSV
jgi:prepilin-type N-terminal cleavage/methylation domain-containing protein